MPIDNPNLLVTEFKESGDFDRLRKELLAEFQQSEGKGKLKSQVEEKVQQRFQTDAKLRFSSQAAAHKELVLEIDRFPIVERAVGDVQSFSDPAFTNKIDDTLHDMLLESKGKRPRYTTRTSSTRTRETDDRALPAKPVVTDSPRKAPASKSKPSEVSIVVTSPTQPVAPLLAASQGGPIVVEPAAKTTTS